MAASMARGLPWHGEVVSIHITPKAEGPMQSVKVVRAIAGKGLEGDRYFRASGTYSDRPGPGREVTLIESEAIEAMARDNELAIAPGEARRNIVTRGAPLNHLVGQEFLVGGVRLRGIRLCEPCSHLEGLTRRGVLAGLIHRGGLRAQILAGGEIRVGDPIAPSDASQARPAAPIAGADEH
jgi:MOSC domain-containing protein YiiM